MTLIKETGMRNCAQLALLVCLVALAGCNQPAVAPKPPALQSSENTVRDWADVAQRIAAEMSGRGLLPPIPPQQAPTPAVPPRPVFIRVQAPDSAFVRAVADQLATDILRIGGTVARAPSGATVVNLDVDFVAWSPRDKPPGLLGVGAALVALPAIIIGDSTPMNTWVAADAAGGSAIGLGILADGIIAMTPTTNAEAIWKATIQTEDQVVMAISEPVYVRYRDLALYAKATELAPLESWSSGTLPLPVRQFR